jgi:hypothetical protein
MREREKGEGGGETYYQITEHTCKRRPTARGKGTRERLASDGLVTWWWKELEGLSRCDRGASEKGRSEKGSFSLCKILVLFQ